jgi:hypothetical protein
MENVPGITSNVKHKDKDGVIHRSKREILDDFLAELTDEI